jgi:TatD DNase family protein
MGHRVSYTGIITFKNAQTVREGVASLPSGTLMVETDCPYLAPVPYRGQRCEPAYTRQVAEKVAEVRKLELPELAEEMRVTTERFFRFTR